MALAMAERRLGVPTGETLHGKTVHLLSLLFLFSLDPGSQLWVKPLSNDCSHTITVQQWFQSFLNQWKHAIMKRWM